MRFNLKDIGQVKKFLELPGKRVNFVKRMGAIEAYDRVTIKSPVLTGRFRQGWNCTINGINYGIPDPAPPEYAKEGRVYYQLDGEKAKTAFASVKIDDDLFISNSLPYAEKLENGYSKQAPQGVVRLTVEELKNDLLKWAKAAKGMDGGFDS